MSEKNTKKAAPVRDLSVKQGFKISRFLVSWEMVLVYILILINLVLMISRTNLYFSQGTIQSIIQSGMDVCPLVLGMIFILMLGDIDVSVASIMIFSSMATGLCCSAGLPAFAGVIAGIAAGAFNGFLIAYVGMPAVIVTIASSMLFRGIVKIILDVNVLKEFPSFYTSVAWTNILGIPIALLLFFAMASVFVFVLHKSKFGRKLYIIGNNPTCAQYSGIDVKKTKMTVFILMGVMCGIASIFFVGRMGGSVSSTMGTGYEMTAIAICVLGGVSTNGGKGKVYGPVIATLIMAFLTYTLGLLDVDANTRKIVTGLILIIAVLIPSLNRELLASLKLKFIYKGNKNVEALNIRTAEEIKVLKRNLESLKQDTSLEQAEKAGKKSRRILRICKRNAKSKRIYGSKSNRKMKSGQRHDLQQNRQNISIGEVLIHKEGGRTYEELETTDSIGVKRNDACITGRVQYHNIKNRSGKREKSGSRKYRRIRKRITGRCTCIYVQIYRKFIWRSNV